MTNSKHGNGLSRAAIDKGERVRHTLWRTAGLAAVLALLALTTAREAGAVFESYQFDPRARALGGAYTGAAGGYFAVFHNPAGLAVVDQMEFGASYVQMFGQSFLKYYGAGMATPINSRFGGLGIGVRRLGVDYKDQSLDDEVTLSIGQGATLYKDISSTVAVGYALHLYSLEFGPAASVDPGSATSFGIDIAARVTLRGRTAVGFLAQNINNPTIGDADVEELPRRVVGGVAYSPYAGVLTTLDMDSKLGQKTRFRGGSEFEVTPYGLLRFGVATDPGIYSAGFGVRYRGMQFNYGFSSGPGVLDSTHQLGISLVPALLGGESEEE